MDTLQSKLEEVRKTLDYKVAKVQSDFAHGLSSFMADKGVSLESIRRSVASSTAIETGESVEEIEKRLKERK